MTIGYDAMYCIICIYCSSISLHICLKLKKWMTVSVFLFLFLKLEKEKEKCTLLSPSQYVFY